METADICSLTVDEIAVWLADNGFPKFHAKQIFVWLHKKRAVSFDEMTDLSLELRKALKNSFYIVTFVLKKKLASYRGNTVKYLYQCHDGELVESVLMRYRHGLTVCVSTQIGCRMGCSFCASCHNGFARNLTASEIEAQIAAAENDAGERVSNVVMMGMGEPLDNYDNSVRLIRLVSSGDGMNIGCRHITVSTCGIVPNIRRLAKENLPVTLSVSLHAVSDNIRSEIMPVNRVYGIRELIGACRYYSETCGRRVSFEYTLINGVNDGESDAIELAKLLRGIMCHINLIPVNPIEERGFTPPTRDRINAFRRRIEESGIPVTVRRTLGADVNASCGQLRNRNIRKSAAGEV